MFYDYDFYYELDETMKYGIKRTLHYMWMLFRTLVLTVVMGAFYIVVTPVRIYEWFKKEAYQEKLDEERFKIWSEKADEVF